MLLSAGRSQMQVWDRLGAFKILTSNLALNHYDQAWRDALFARLDNLLEPDDWDAADELPGLDAFRTFLRFFLSIQPARQPALGVTDEGHVLAGWLEGRDRLTLECMPQDRIRWTLTKYVDNERVAVAGESPTRLLRAHLQPFDTDTWWRVRK